MRQAGSCYFAATGHNLCGAFEAFWRKHFIDTPGPGPYPGSLALFGQPLTEARVERTPDGVGLVQWFERARFELLPDKDGRDRVLLGALGIEVYQEVRLPPNPGPTPSMNGSG